MTAQQKGVVSFIFLGGVGPSRGLEYLIDNWSDTPTNAVLHIRSPDNAYLEKLKEIARSTRIGNHKINFLNAIPEIDLLSALDGYDVGIIPYEPACANNIHCCPNKLSQYMSKGLAILANKLSFVEETIRKAQCGASVDFTNKKLFCEAVKKLCEDDIFREKCRRNAFQYYREVFNWQEVSREFYEILCRLTPAGTISEIRLLDRRVSSPKDSSSALRIQWRHRGAAFLLKIYRVMVPQHVRVQVWEIFSIADKLSNPR